MPRTEIFSDRLPQPATRKPGTRRAERSADSPPDLNPNLASGAPEWGFERQTHDPEIVTSRPFPPAIKGGDR
jgi:hypothetical protein